MCVETDRQKGEALCAEAGSYAPGSIKSYERRVVKLRRCLLSTDPEQALADLDTGMRQQREWVAWRISATEFRRRRDGQGLAELTRVERECDTGAQRAGPLVGQYRGHLCDIGRPIEACLCKARRRTRMGSPRWRK